MKKINFKFEINRKKLIFGFSFIFFIYLLYLSIPSLYDTGRVQKDIIKKLNNVFNLNFSLSTDISYRILPVPHFVIKDCELIQFESNVSTRIAEIQQLKIFINQSNLFKKDIEIKDLQISKANFFINKSNFKFVRDFIGKSFSEKNINVNKSKIFFKDDSGEVLFIYTIKDLNLNLNQDDNKNILDMRGKIFNIDNKLNWSKNFDTQKKIFKLISNKIFLDFKNEATLKNNKYEYINDLEIQSNKFKTQYTLNDDVISFFSKRSLIKNTIINYQGNITLNPFNFLLKINSKQVDFDYFFKNLNLLNEVLLSKLLFKKNLYGQITIETNTLSKAKLFDAASININFQGGDINLNETLLTSNKIGNLKISDSKFLVENGSLIFQGKSKLNIDNIDNFYKIFLMPKKYRFKLSSMDFIFQFNPNNGKFKIKKILLFDDKNKPFDTKISDRILSENDDNVFSYLNSIKFKNFINDFLVSYSDEG